MPEPILTAQGLNCFYGNSQVIRDISLSIPEKGCVAIIGRNGAGKTTLMQTLSGEMRQRDGSIALASEDVSRSSTHNRVRKGLGYVPQDMNIFSAMTVLENLQIGARNAPDFRERMAVTMELFPKLGQRLYQKAGTLSGGERKMVAIARALLGNPRLLMLDEPTEGVWHAVIAEIGDRLKSLSQTMSVLIVEQHLGLALEISNYCYVMERGRIALEGPTSEVRANPQLETLLAP